MFKPRWYQQEACDAFWQFVETNHDASRNPVLVLPTGTGKSVIIAYIIQHAVKTWDNIRVLMLTHVGELVKQNAGKLSSIWPEADIGICSATLGHKDTENSIIFGNVQSVAPLLKRDANAFGMRNLIVIDECHMLSEDENSQYRQVIAALKKLRPQMRVLGLSATPYRMKGGYLTEQKNAVFTDIVYDLNSQFERLIKEGYLAPVTTLKTKPHVDLTGVGTRAGDYKLDELQKACGDDAMLKNSLVEVVKRSSGRRAWIVFIAGIENCNKCAQLLREMSVSAYAVNSSFSADENATKIEAFRKGEIRCLVSADQLTTGFDVPQVDLIAMLRPTKSPGLYVQMIGRGLRPAEGKTDCLVLDFARNIERLGPINNPFIRARTEKKASSKQQAPVRSCPGCQAYIPVQATVCPHCGQKIERNLELELKAGVLIERTFGHQPKPGRKIATVISVDYTEYKSVSGNVSFCAVYTCIVGGKKRTIKKWLAFNQKKTSIGYLEATKSWRELSSYPYKLVPLSVEEAMQRTSELKTPLGLEFIPRNFYFGSKFDEVTEFLFNEENDSARSA